MAEPVHRVEHDPGGIQAGHRPLDFAAGYRQPGAADHQPDYHFAEVNRVFNNTQIQMSLELPAKIAQAIVIIAIFGYCIDLLTLIWKGIRILTGLTDNHAASDQKEVK